MAGIPPLAGFFGKLSIFLAILGSHMYTLTLISIFLSTINAYVYIRILKILWSDRLILGLENSKLYDHFFMFLTNYIPLKSKVLVSYELVIKLMLKGLLLYIITMHIFFTCHLSWARILMYGLITVTPKCVASNIYF
jgi:NADH:ubiquinone oxidoreductase subunit 2 (subunit N)